ncbi:THAP domain-containing protein 7 [Conger conger]|uniref:THAP domain-containing protein 7 n=1 Tax=Conger conger TaxID=82655 RepID=UPI002A59EE6B|nr:THAP domain-containing protein 7 [Conger conger]
MMPRHCSAAGCKSRDTRETRKAGITFHRLPKRGKPRRNLWIVNSRRTGPHGKGQWDPQSQFIYFCSKHFTPESFELSGVSGYRRLKEDALPTVFETLPRQRRSAAERAQRGAGKQAPAKRRTRRQSNSLKQEKEEAEPQAKAGPDAGGGAAVQDEEKSDEGWEESDLKNKGEAKTDPLHQTLPAAPSPPPASLLHPSSGSPQVPSPLPPAETPPSSPLPSTAPAPSPSEAAAPDQPPSPSRYMRRLPPPPGFYLAREHSYAQPCPLVWKKRYDRAMDSLERSVRLLNAARRREARLRQTLLWLRDARIRQGPPEGPRGGRAGRPGERGARHAPGAELRDGEAQRMRDDLALMEAGLRETGEWAGGDKGEDPAFCLTPPATAPAADVPPPAAPQGEGGDGAEQRLFWVQQGADGRLLLLPVPTGEVDDDDGMGVEVAVSAGGRTLQPLVSLAGFQKAAAGDEGERRGLGAGGPRTRGRGVNEAEPRAVAGSGDVRERLKEHLEGFQLQLSNEFIH